MMKRSLLFVGCGSGEELGAFAKLPDTQILACDPNKDYCAVARARFSHIESVSIVMASVQELAASLPPESIDEAYLLFPVPVVLALEAQEIARALFGLLGEGAMVQVVSEVVPLLRQPSEEESRFFNSFLYTLKHEGFLLKEESQLAFSKLPQAAQDSAYGKLFHEHGASIFTYAVLQRRRTNEYRNADDHVRE